MVNFQVTLVSALQAKVKKLIVSHVVATLFGLSDAFRKNPIITYQTTTQQLQIFHRQAKRHLTSPVKIRDMGSKKFKKYILPDED